MDDELEISIEPLDHSICRRVFGHGFLGSDAPPVEPSGPLV